MQLVLFILNNFSSNNYLNLANNKKLKIKLKKCVDEYGIGSGASPLISGYSKAHESLEKCITKLLGFESTLVSNSGYLTEVFVAGRTKASLDMVVDSILKVMTRIPIDKDKNITTTENGDLDGENWQENLSRTNPKINFTNKEENTEIKTNKPYYNSISIF